MEPRAITPRPRLGRADPARRAGQDRDDKRIYVWFDAVIGYLSASVEWARRTGGSWESFWHDGGRRRLLLHGQGQRRLPLGHLAGDPARLAGRPLRRARPAVRGGVVGVPHDGGQEVLLVAVGRHLRPRRPRALRPRRAPLLPVRRRPGERRHRLHVGAVRHPQQHRARRRLGQPRQPRDVAGQQEHRLDPRGRRPDAEDDRAALEASQAAFGTVGDAARPQPAEGRASTRRCGSSARRTSTCRRWQPWKLQGATRSAGRRCCTSRCSSSATPRRC